MAIIYSYERENNPQLGDLLLGTDVSASGKPTKLFSIQDIVNLVEPNVPGGGTVTSIDAAGGNFITMSGGPITTTGTISATLSATGVPSATTYLRGDNTWANLPTFTGVTYTLITEQNGLNSNIILTGSDTSETIVSLIAGANVSLTSDGGSGIIIGLTGGAGGIGVASVTAGDGLQISSGSATFDPTLAIDLTGNNNYIKIGENQTTPLRNDIIAFNQTSSTNVKTTRLSAIPADALSLVKDYIDAGDVGDVRNTQDTFASTAKVANIVSLTSAEYTALTPKKPGTLYVIIPGSTVYTNTLAFTNNIIGTEYTLTGNQAGDTVQGVLNEDYAFSTSIAPNDGFYFSSGPTITNASGVFSTSETVYTILSGTVVPIDESAVVATLAVSTSGVDGTQFTLGGDLPGATQSGTAPLSYSFNTTITPSPGYEFTTGPTIVNASGTINGSQTVVTYISGTIEQVITAPITVTAQVNTAFTGSAAAQATATVTPGSFSGTSPLSYTFDVSASANAGYYFVSGPTITGDLTGTSTSSRNAIINVTGQVEAISTTAIVTLNVNNSISGPSAGYTLGGNLTGAVKSGNTPFTYAFNTTVTLNSGYEWVDGIAPTINNAAGTTSIIGNQTVITSISGAQVVETIELVNATLDVNYDISGPAVWSPAGYLTGETQSGLPPFTYDFGGVNVPTIIIPNDYVFTAGPTQTGALTGTISTNTSVPITVSATIEAALPPLYGYNITAGPGGGETTFGNACGLTTSSVFFADDIFENIGYGTKIYLSATGGIFQGQNEWYGIAATGTIATQSIRIDNNGDIIDIASCSNSFDFSAGTSISVSNSLPGTNPKTTTISGTLTITGSAKTFRIGVSVPFNLANSVNSVLTISGYSISAGGAGSSSYTSLPTSITLPAGSYPYTFNGTLTINPPLTSGVMSTNIIQVT
jgi:hypothetical protein